MEDAEVRLAFPSTANKNRVEQLGREARSPREREAAEQRSDRSASLAACSPSQPRPPQPTPVPPPLPLARDPSRREDQLVTLIASEN